MKVSLSVLTLLITLNGVLPTTVPAAEGAAKPAASAKSTAAPRVIRWPELVPPGWDPMVVLREKNKDRGATPLTDFGPGALQMMREMREIWDNAPLNVEMDGALVKLPGYVVPLEEVQGALKEFLLVPYFGACIHSPPPPANQIVHVVADRPARGVRSMDVVWVSGRLHARRQDSYMGKSGYHLQASKIEAYVPPPR
jgi:hypothetical protein